MIASYICIYQHKKGNILFNSMLCYSIVEVIFSHTDLKKLAGKNYIKFSLKCTNYY